MNEFYTYPKWIQWMITLLLLGVGLAAMALWLGLMTYHVLLYFSFFLIIPIFQFAFTPIFRMMGLYKYLSPMLLVYAPSAKKYDLHNGTSFDYLFVMRQVEKGRPFQIAMLGYYVQGLLRIIEELENGDIPPTIEITGTSYFFSASTARRLGFELVTPSAFYKFNLYANYLDLFWMYSMAKGKWTFPDLKGIKAAVTTGEALCQRKVYLLDLQEHLDSR